MSTVIINTVRKGLYLDSVALMRMSRLLADLDGVEEAAMMMGMRARLLLNAMLQKPEKRLSHKLLSSVSRQRHKQSS